MSAQSFDTDVIISGGGPCGLVLAHELGRRGIRAILFNDKATTTPHPQAGATQARTMEHYRRLGVSKRVREAGLPPDYPTDVAYFTRLTERELSRLEQPASGNTDKLIRSMSGAWSAAELPHRVSQMLVERILREEAEKLTSLSLKFGWRVTGFTEKDDHVEVAAVSDNGDQKSFTAQYLVGADGARSEIRKQLGIRYVGEKTMDRPFLSGQMYSTFFRSSQIYDLIPHRRSWQYWFINPERRGMILSLNGKTDFVFMTQLRPGEEPDKLSDDFIKNLMFRAMGKPFELEIIARSPWTAGLALVAEHFQEGRVFLGGDAVHLFTPTGGMGYNTAVEDAVNLGWKLAAVVKGWGGVGLLESYERERAPVALRNTGFARQFAESIGRLVVPPELEENTEAGEAARKATGEYLLNHARKEFNIPGFTLGARYDGSPVIIADGTPPPPDGPNIYHPTASPGGRAPHAWLADGRSLYDAFSFEFTLLLLAPNTPSLDRIIEAAKMRGIPLTVLDVSNEGLRDLYEADLALIRPDQIVCWRGNQFPSDPGSMLDQVTGHKVAS